MDNDLETEIIKVTLEGTELYQYDFGTKFPVEGGREIRKQAKNYQLSEIKMKEGNLMYNFQSKDGFKGSETVEIVERGSIGDNNYKDYYKWIFEIEVN